MVSKSILNAFGPTETLARWSDGPKSPKKEFSVAGSVAGDGAWPMGLVGIASHHEHDYQSVRSSAGKQLRRGYERTCAKKHREQMLELLNRSETTKSYKETTSTS